MMAQYTLSVMERNVPPVLLVLLLVCSLAAVPAAVAVEQANSSAEAAIDAQSSNDTDANGSDPVLPGERFSGVTGSEGATIGADIQTRAYALQLSNATTANATAAIIAAQLNSSEQRLDALRERKAELEAAYENDSVSRGEYRSQMAVLAVEIRQVSKMANQSETASAGLPEETLEANGVNTSAIQTLEANASSLIGPEVASIARSIAGPPAEAGNGSDRRGPPDDSERGPPAGTPGNGAENESSNGSERGAADGPSGEQSENQSAGNDTQSSTDGTSSERHGSDSGGSTDSQSTDGSDARAADSDR